MQRLSHVTAIHNLINQKHANRMSDIMRRIHGGGDNVLIAAKRGEYMIPEHIVRKKGVKYFDKMIGGKPPKVMGPTGMPHYLQGGQIESGLGSGLGGFNEPTPIPYGTPNPRPTPMTIWGGREGGIPTYSGSGPQSSMNTYNNFGYLPNQGWAPQGATAVPTNWTNYPGFGYVPNAFPAYGYGDPGQAANVYHMGQTKRRA